MNAMDPRKAFAVLFDGKFTRADVLAILALLVWLVPIALQYLPESPGPAGDDAPASSTETDTEGGSG